MIALTNRLILVFSFVGLFVAGSLSLSHHSGGSVGCATGRDCETVAEYVAKNWGNFPVADLGLAAYVLIAVLAVVRIFMGSKKTIRPAFLISSVGAVLSIFLTAFAYSVIKASCSWCLASMGCMIGLAVAHYFLQNSSADVEPVMNPIPDGILVAIGVIAATIGVFSSQQPTLAESKFTGVKIEDLIVDPANRLGSKDAPVQVVEFFDLMCPHCRKTYAASKLLVSENDGKLAWSFRHWPINAPKHEFSKPAAVIAEICADEGVFFQFCDLVTAREPEDMSADLLLDMAAQAGADRAKVAKRVDDPKDPAYSRLIRDLDYANEKGFLVVPVLFIGRRGEQVTFARNETIGVAMKKYGIDPEPGGH